MEPFNFSFFSITGWDIDLDYCDIEWFVNTWSSLIALKTLITWVSIFIDCAMTRKLTNCNAEKPLKVILLNVRVLAEKFVSLHCVKLDLVVSLSLLPIHWP